jgi:hypothetical protein
VIRHFGISVMVHLIQRGWPCGWLCLESMKCTVAGIFLKAAQCLSDRQFSHRPPIGLICPSGGVSTGVSSLISDFPKNILVHTHPKSNLQLSHPTPPEGRIAIVTDAGRDAVDAVALGAQRGCRAGWRKARERSNGELTNDVAAYGEVVWS